jgi:hypothetical protein
MKCLEKDRGRRYETANGLAVDIQRYLNNEPVLARPPSRLYRLQKFARRNKVMFTATVAVTVALVSGLGLATIGFVRARAERNQAVAAERRAQQEKQAADEARLQAQDSESKARTAELLTRQRAYVSDMNLVQQAWDEGRLQRAQALLSAYVPKPREPDLRGFEWRYLWRLCRDESRLSFTNFPSGVRMVLSPDGKFAAAASKRFMRLLDYENGRELDTLAVYECDRGHQCVGILSRRRQRAGNCLQQVAQLVEPRGPTHHGHHHTLEPGRGSGHLVTSI